MDPRAGLGLVRKILPPPGCEPILCRSTDYALLASKRLWIPLNKKWLSPRVGLVALETNMICLCSESNAHSPVIYLLN